MPPLSAATLYVCIAHNYLYEVVGIVCAVHVPVGSVYCDESIWFAGSVGEGIKSSNVLVVKSHNHDRDWAKQSTNDSDWVSLLVKATN